MKTEKDWWVLAGGRSRVGRVLAEALAPRHNLVLTSSRPWQGEEAWLERLSTDIRTCQWNAEVPDFGSTIMADLERLGAGGVCLAHGVILAGNFPEQPLGS
jgi:hypothetical protein